MSDSAPVTDAAAEADPDEIMRDVRERVRLDMAVAEQNVLPATAAKVNVIAAVKS